jgi:hypothetical protein
MAVDPPASARRCSACHAVLPRNAKQCWLCGASISDELAIGASQNAFGRFSVPPDGAHASFSLATLMLYMTLAAIVCGVFSIAPGAGAALALVLIPVLAHSTIQARKERELGHLVPASEKIAIFLTSFVIVVVAGVAASVAFGITCFAGFWGGAAAGSAVSGGYGWIGFGFVVGIGLGCLAGVYVGYFVIVTIEQRMGTTLSTREKLILSGAVAIAAIGAVTCCMLSFR